MAGGEWTDELNGAIVDKFHPECLEQDTEQIEYHFFTQYEVTEQTEHMVDGAQNAPSISETIGRTADNVKSIRLYMEEFHTRLFDNAHSKSEFCAPHLGSVPCQEVAVNHNSVTSQVKGERVPALMDLKNAKRILRKVATEPEYRSGTQQTSRLSKCRTPCSGKPRTAWTDDRHSKDKASVNSSVVSSSSSKVWQARPSSHEANERAPSRTGAFRFLGRTEIQHVTRILTKYR